MQRQTTIPYAVGIVLAVLVATLLSLLSAMPALQPALAQSADPPEEPTATDRAALVALYDATDGDNWTDNANWKSDKPLNQWSGISTNADGRVTIISLSNNRLTGTIPPQLGSLTNLWSLRLCHNYLDTSSVPSALYSGCTTRLRPSPSSAHAAMGNVW